MNFVESSKKPHPFLGFFDEFLLEILSKILTYMHADPHSPTTTISTSSLPLNRKNMEPFSELVMVSAADHVVDVPDRLQATTDDDLDGSPPQPAIDTDREVEDLCLKLTRDAKAQYENVEKMVKQRDSDSLRDFGGAKGIADALYTDVENGITDEEILSRCFGSSNSLPQAPPHKQLTNIVFKSCNDCTVILLLLYAFLVGGFGMGMKGPHTGWCESLVIFISIVALVALRSAHEFWKLRKQQEMEKKKDENVKVRVIRGGVEINVSISELVPGDVVLLKRGDLIPADGLFVSGPSLALDDEKLSVDEERNPFLFYGGKVINGHGRMLVVSVGVDAEFRELTSELMSTSTTTATTTDIVSPFQHQLNRVIKVTQNLGISMCILLICVLFVHFKITKHQSRFGSPNLKDNKPTSVEALLKILKIFIEGPKEKISVLAMVALSMLGMSEGLPFFIAVAIIYWNKKFFDGASIRDLSASVTMGFVNTICIDKTGLALYPWQVDRSFVGDKAIDDDTEVASNVLECIAEGMVVTQIANSSAEEDPVLIFWAESKFSLDMEKKKQGFVFLRAKELEWSDGGSAVLIEKKEADNIGQTDQIWHYRAGAREILEKSSYFYDTSNGERKQLDEQKRKYFEESIDEMESDGLKIIAFANKQDEGEKDLVMVGLLGLKKTCCKQTKEAIKECNNGGIKIALLTQDSLPQAEEIALRHGIINENSTDQLVIDAETFRDYNSEQRMRIVDKICVLANCLPQDKLLLLKCLKEKKQITAMVIFNANNVPAVREADVAIALDTHSTSLAKESADIIIKGCYFSCLVTIISYGGSIFFNTQKQIQAEITMFVSGMLITLVASAISSSSPISGIQFAWVYSLVAIVAGVGHWTDCSGGKLMKHTPGKRRVSLLTKGMILNIALHLIYQVAVLLTVRFKLQKAMGMNTAGKTFIFNSFFFCQIFNVLAREMEKMKMVKDIIHKQKLLWLAVIAATILQAMFIHVSVLSSSPSLSWSEWMVCFLVGLLPFLIDCGATIVKRKLNDSTATHSNLETPLIT